jgi:biotin carboxylase
MDKRSKAQYCCPLLFKKKLNVAAALKARFGAADHTTEDRMSKGSIARMWVETSQKVHLRLQIHQKVTVFHHSKTSTGCVCLHMSKRVHGHAYAQRTARGTYLPLRVHDTQTNHHKRHI